MEAAAIGKILETFGLPVGIIAVLGALIWQLVGHITKNTVPMSVYTKTCEMQKSLEGALSKTTDAVNEQTSATNTTNELIRILVGRETS